MILAVLGGDKYNKGRYTDTLKMLNDLFTRSQGRHQQLGAGRRRPA